jgi:hypothetical protein
MRPGTGQASGAILSPTKDPFTELLHFYKLKFKQVLGSKRIEPGRFRLQLIPDYHES